MTIYDIIVIGGGAAGFSAAMKANELKAKVLMINNDSIGLGGTCVNVGCVPTKYLLHIAKIIREAKLKKYTGLSLTTSFDYAKIIEGKNLLVKTLQSEKYKRVLDNLSNVKLVNGNAQFVSKSEILVNGKEIYRGEKFIITTGSSPFIPPIEGLDKIEYLTNITALQLKKVPSSLAIIGGGALGVEFAQLFSRFGSKVQLFEMMEKIVPNEEPEISDFLQQYLSMEGIEIHAKCKITKVKEQDNELIISTEIDGRENLFKSEQLLIAVGRKPNTENLSLEKHNIKLGKKGEIIVDEFLKASDNIWAAGDVIGEPMLETVAAREGMIAGNNAVSNDLKQMDFSVIPHAVFTDPQIGSIGLTDLEANQQGFVCSCRTIPLKLVPKAGIIHDTHGALKMVINYETEEILGIHILSDEAADLIHEGVMIIKNRMKLDDVINTLHVFPTLSEGIKLVAQSFKRDISKMTCCAE
ncbi:MAG: mercury(II) reductase [Promethearchaeota archaeon]